MEYRKVSVQSAKAVISLKWGKPQESEGYYAYIKSYTRIDLCQNVRITLI